jgi:predicted kinase
VLVEPFPILVLITGAPGAGKSTLASILSARLGLPLVRRDDIKSGIAASVGRTGPTDGRPQPDRQQMLPRGVIAQRTFNAFPNIVETYLDHGISCMLDNSWLPGTSHVLLPCLAKSRAISIHCSADEDVLLRRIVDRAGNYPVGAYNADAQLLEEIRAKRTTVTARSAPLDQPTPCLFVDTTDGYQPTVDDVCQFVWLTAAGLVPAGGT